MTTKHPPEPMNVEEFRQWGKAMIDFVADYWSGLPDRPHPMPFIEPGDVKAKLPTEPPEEPEPWETIFKDAESVVLDGTTHWHHPKFFAYFPTACSYPAIIGDILSDGLSCIGFTWKSSPACTEVEMAMMDWLAKALNLPEHFLFSHDGPGGGVIQCTASDSTLVAMLAARARTLAKHSASNTASEAQNSAFQKLLSTVQAKMKALKETVETLIHSSAQNRLVAYCSDQAHSSVERAALLASVTIRKLTTDSSYHLTGPILEQAIEEDLKKGLIPFCVIATLGTTNSCSFDNLEELGPICQKRDIWLHVDAAYAGSAFICPEYRHYMAGLEMVDSFNFNPHKWLLINFDCSPMWFKNAKEVEMAFHVDPLYLKHEQQGLLPDYRHWQIPLGRRFRSLKIWFVLRSFGLKGLREHIRNQCQLAKDFEDMLKTDERFEIVVPVVMGLVCFRVKNESNELNEKLLQALNKDGQIHLVPSTLHGTYILRLAICSTLTQKHHLSQAWKIIQDLTTKILEEKQQTQIEEIKPSFEETEGLKEINGVK